nr:NADH:flavin oxidoreductase / NADH oxidase family [uncultured bacterium]
MSLLFSPLTLRGVTLRNRTVVSPMCQYSAKDGIANDWHFVHLGRFALGGFGLVILEATGVTPEGRISYGDLGLWNDDQIAPLAGIVEFLKKQGAAAGIQLGHAGRKASTPVWWRGGFTETEDEKPRVGYQSWIPLAPSPIIHSQKQPNDFQTPAELDHSGIARIVQAFADAARRADKAGFDLIELHGAHGYLISEFLSPISNHRTDEYGGSRENRMRFAFEVVDAVRATWPADKPLSIRISTTDGSPGGWSVEDSQVLARELAARGVDIIDCSSGGFDGYGLKPAPLYQVPLAKAVRDTGIKTMTVGLIGNPRDAETILERGDADLIALARGALDDPNWPIHAHHALDGGGEVYDLWPIQARNRIRDRDRVLGRYT